MILPNNAKTPYEIQVPQPQSAKGRGAARGLSEEFHRGSLRCWDRSKEKRILNVKARAAATLFVGVWIVKDEAFAV